MNYKYIEKNINIRENLIIEPCLLENNEKQIASVCDFLMSDKKFFLMNGFIGTGKTLLVNYISQFLNPDVLTIKYTCFETTILDDMLLNFFDNFRDYTIAGKIKPPKLKVDNFTQKVNMYFETVKNPILIVINSFEAVLKSNKNEVLNFLKHIAKFENVKIIITSRVFSSDDFTDVEIDGTTVLAFSKEIFEKYLKQNDIKNIGVLSNELYKQTKGYYHYLNLSVKIMKLRGYNLVKFLEVFSKSLLSFPDFILREALNLIDPVSLHLFRLLAVMRIPIHLNLLKYLHLFNQGQIQFFVENSILNFEGESIYLADYYREIVERQIQDSVMIKLHRSCVELYNTQLPLKPFERDLRLSRQTMRNEIEYHSLFLPKKIDRSQVKISQQPVQTEISQEVVTPKETKEKQIEKINFIIEDEGLLNDIAGSITDFVNEKVEENELAINSTNLSLTEILNDAKHQEVEYNYKNAVLLYQSALTKKDDDNFDKFLPLIYTKLGNVYKKLSQYYEALEYFTKAQDFYYNAGQIEKANYAKLEIANIYFAIYKHDNAKYILNELDKDENLANDLRIQVNLSLAKFSNNINQIYSYLKKSLSLVEYTTDKKISSELYYRFAIVNDEMDDVNTAGIFYKKCIENDKDFNHNEYLSKALASLAQLYDEAGNSESAIKYYEKSIEIDLQTQNYNGLYSSSRHLSEIYSSKDEKLSLKYLNEAQKYATKLNEPYYIADVLMEIGNYYLLRKDYENSYKYFNQAYDVAKISFSKDNADKILKQIEYVKSLKNAG